MMFEDTEKDGKKMTKEEKSKWNTIPNCRREGNIYQQTINSNENDKEKYKPHEKDKPKTTLKPPTQTYTGESSRSIFERLKEHQKAIDNGDINSPLVEHAIETHEGTKPDYIMCATNLELNPLRRLITEAVLISDRTKLN